MVQIDFLTPREVRGLGLAGCGRHVLIRKTARLVDPEMITLGDNIVIDDFAIIYGGGGVTLEGHNHIGTYGALFGRAGIVMEAFSGTAPRVSIFSESDDYSGRSMTNPTVPDEFKPKFKLGKVRIGRHVIVGANSTILPSCTVAEGCAVGAYSLVTGALEPWGVYAGVPAKRVSERAKDVLDLEKKYRGEASQ